MSEDQPMKDETTASTNGHDVLVTAADLAEWRKRLIELKEAQATSAREIGILDRKLRAAEYLLIGCHNELE